MGAKNKKNEPVAETVGQKWDRMRESIDPGRFGIRFWTRPGVGGQYLDLARHVSYNLNTLATPEVCGG